MELVYQSVGIEVTRRCNQLCGDYCMRGPMENIDIPLYYIDLLLDRNVSKYKEIKTLLFSGGEPTLNSEAIAYTIDKIIQKKLPIQEVQMVTNGLVYSDQIVEAFEKYNDYYNSVVLTELLERVPIELQQITKDSWMNLGSHICFSDDQYHRPISEEILDLYLRNGKNIIYSYTGRVEDSSLLKSGFSKRGRSLDLSHDSVRIFSNTVIDLIYLTAKGGFSCYGDGSFEFLDEVSKEYSILNYSLDEFCLEKKSKSSRGSFSDKKVKVFQKK